MMYKMYLSNLSLALFVSLSLLVFSSCDEFIEYPENIGCGTEISISAEVSSDTFSVADITKDSPLGIVKVTLPLDGETSRGYDKGLIDEDGKVIVNYPPIWKTKPVKFIAWWPASAKVICDDNGKIASISEDCKLIGETVVFSIKPQDAHIILRDFISE